MPLGKFFNQFSLRKFNSLEIIESVSGKKFPTFFFQFFKYTHPFINAEVVISFFMKICT